jgi:hypothetical protein
MAPLVATGAVLLAACGGGGPGSPRSGEWAGTVTTEGNVTTVINESGSVWGGPAELVEDLSIGVESGDDAYMFGRIDGIGATEDRIYVLEDRPPAVRVYGHDGRHLFDFGGAGEGPGELNNPVTMGVDPGGRVMVQDLRRVTVYSLEGEPLDTWPYRGGLILPITVALDGTTWIPWNWRDDEGFHAGLMAVAPDGSEGRRVDGPDYDYEPWQLTARQGGRTMMASVPYAPGSAFAVLPSGAVAQGLRDRYRFEVHRPDGSVLVIERAIEPPPISTAEAEWRTATTAARLRAYQPGWAWTARPIPGHKPAFQSFAGDRWGRIWVQRILRTDEAPDCEPGPPSADERVLLSCWTDVMGWDVFDEATGRFLGSVEQPAPFTFRPPPAFLEDGMLAVVEDEAGTLMVKRYRLALPG